MTNEITQNKIYWCRKCQSEAMTANPTCSKCGRNMWTQSTVKGWGKLLIGLGGFITLGSGLGGLASVLVIKSGKLKGHEIDTASVALTACLVLTALGSAAFFGGIRQVETGRTSKVFMRIYLGIVVVILMLGSLFSIVKG